MEDAGEEQRDKREEIMEKMNGKQRKMGDVNADQKKGTANDNVEKRGDVGKQKDGIKEG